MYWENYLLEQPYKYECSKKLNTLYSARGRVAEDIQQLGCLLTQALSRI